MTPEEEYIPDQEEQVALILAGKCPHNLPWKRYYSYCHNDDHYECTLCGKVE